MGAILKEKSKSMDEVNQFGESPLYIAIKVLSSSIIIELRRKKDGLLLKRFQLQDYSKTQITELSETVPQKVNFLRIFQ